MTAIPRTLEGSGEPAVDHRSTPAEHLVNTPAAPRPSRGAARGTLADVGRNDARLELEQVGITRVDRGAHPVGLAGAEGLHAGEVAEHAATWQIDRLIDLEVVRV